MRGDISEIYIMVRIYSIFHICWRRKVHSVEHTNTNDQTFKILQMPIERYLYREQNLGLPAIGAGGGWRSESLYSSFGFNAVSEGWKSLALEHSRSF